MEKAKIKSEHRWGVVLGVIGSDLVRPLSVIEGVLQEVLQEMKKCVIFASERPNLTNHLLTYCIKESL